VKLSKPARYTLAAAFGFTTWLAPDFYIAVIVFIVCFFLVIVFKGKEIGYVDLLEKESEDENSRAHLHCRQER
jgi:hypothetical protein